MRYILWNKGDQESHGNTELKRKIGENQVHGLSPKIISVILQNKTPFPVDDFVTSTALLGALMARKGSYSGIITVSGQNKGTLKFRELE